MLSKPLFLEGGAQIQGVVVDPVELVHGDVVVTMDMPSPINFMAEARFASSGIAFGVVVTAEKPSDKLIVVK